MLGQLFALLTAFCWAHNSVFYSIAGKRVGSPTVTHIRLWVALPAVIIVHFFFLGSFIPAIEADLSFWLIAVSGFVGFFVADIFIFYGFVEIGPGRTLLILTLSPIISAVISFFALEETLGAMQITGIAVTVAGIIMVIYHENRIEKISSGVFRGILIAVLGAVAQSAAMVLSKMGLAGGMHPVSANVIRISFGFLGLVVFSALRGQFFRDFSKMKANPKSFSLIAVAALIGPVLGIILTLYALKLAPVGIVTTLTQISPVILLPVEAIFFGRKISLPVIAGTSVAVAGAVLLFMF